MLWLLGTVVALFKPMKRTNGTTNKLTGQLVRPQLGEETMTVTERIETAKKLAKTGSRGVELGRRDLVMAKQAIEKALKEVETMTNNTTTSKLDRLSSHLQRANEEAGSRRADTLAAAIMMIDVAALVLASEYIEEMDAMGNKREHAAAGLAEEISKRI